MSVKEKMRKLCGAYVRKLVATEEGAELYVWGYEKCPDYMYWEIMINGESACGRCDFDSIVTNAYSMDLINHGQAIQFENAISYYMERQGW
jgi:hypothetical protein